MSEKIAVIFLCAALGTAAGLMVSARYKRSLAYVDGVCAMIAELKRNISYKRESVPSILGRLEPESRLLNKHIGEYTEYSRKKDGALEISRGSLSADTYAKVCALFGALGGADGRTQLGELEMHSGVFAELRARAERDRDRYGPLAIKLGFLFGLAAGVMFL